jgi:TRAP-type C4-dicarboxylate transport system substrate-binding protein
VFKVWQRGIRERTGGNVEIQFFWNGVQGDEHATVGKMRIGQLDGGCMSSNGLSEIYPQVLVMELPGLFSSWAKLDTARNKLKGTFDAEFAKAGFVSLGWGDAGATHFITKGFEVRRPADLQHKNTCYGRGDRGMPILYSLIGNVTPKEVGFPEILPMLTAGTVNTVTMPSLAAEQLQWTPQLDTINDLVPSYMIGACIVSSAKLKQLPEEWQTAVRETGALATSALTTSIRSLDDAAYARLRGRMKATNLTEAERAEWAALFAQVRRRVRGAGLDATLVDAVEEAAK